MARPYQPRRWVTAPADPAGCLALAGALGISPVTAQVLWNRGLTTPAAARAFLAAGLDALHDPYRLQDMEKAVHLLRQRVAARRPVLVWGDYDADGLCATAIAVQTLTWLGCPVAYHIPHRLEEGYGLSLAGLERARDQGWDFILCVDNGIAAVAEAEAARRLGITLVVTDHHEPGPALPPAAAVVNPRRPDCPYPFKGLCGAGVAFKLAQALLGDDPRLLDLVDLVALATVADVVPLLDENRALVREGLARLCRRPGTRALLAVAGLAPDVPPTAQQVAFALAPRLNALGRLGDARDGVRLLLTADPAEAEDLAQRLDAENRSRQAVENQILAEALALWEQQPPHVRDHAAVLAAPGWHPGVVGICAARLVEATHRPVVLLAVADGVAKGSARSIPGFPLHRALYECRDLLTRFGGHAAAAGLTLPAQNVPALRERLCALAREWLGPDDRVPKLAVDAWVAPDQITPQLVDELARLEPFGHGNPPPVLALAGAQVVEGRAVGRDAQHLKLRVRAGLAVYDAIGFGLAQDGAPGAGGLAPGQPVALAFAPEWNEWNGRRQVQLVLADLHVGGGGGPQVPGLEAWDPLAGLPDGALAPAGAAAVAPPASPVAAGAPVPALRAARPDPAGTPLPPLHPLLGGGAGPRERAAAVVALGQDGPVLVVCASPWAQGAVAAALREALAAAPLPAAGGCPALGPGAVALWVPGESCPGPGARWVVACWGGMAGAPAPFAAAVVWHPPYHLGQLAAAAPLARTWLAAWDPSDWDLLARTLAWPYPDREALVGAWRLIQRRGPGATVEELAHDLAAAGLEPAGPWNRLRAQAAAQIFAELGLLALRQETLQTVLPAGERRDKMNLLDSARYRRGEAGREALRRCRAHLDPAAIG